MVIRVHYSVFNEAHTVLEKHLDAQLRHHVG
ncbi:hypothetical protein F441_00698 [Phytophthora nicotianae CJ01A1]|uniref:Uncharacterized protein n=3 Tax=Phytophthora nicotianae TaxID=4792 RepID=W2RFJ4_PHYN3|nr:hypothetical protein PPTG_20761 [Phytophthora nicotianae INRA-310]ETK96694.1 hypothetical protein L915_00654 [Phytophthora nicotianae]ETP26690.1 hypothetical protein F441_00698 [Phytophthora nicotianae CJ01A1]ETL50047.1 hypothetical protein L916_00655 [Phytophthora nicotianae]ETM56374.1 hypothetical protein L914_00645 [Phytophthora nicotianae]ETN24162.1 hypothetical protein PPTG_20761 [Phytophthora nicotianae INRA-310]